MGLSSPQVPDHAENKANDINFIWNNVDCVCWIHSSSKQLSAWAQRPFLHIFIQRPTPQNIQ